MTASELQQKRPHVHQYILDAHTGGLKPKNIAGAAGVSLNTVEAVLATVEVADWE